MGRLRESLANELRAAGLRVTEEPGWQKRGRSNLSPRGCMFHHTVSSTRSNMPSRKIVTHGRKGVPGPLYNILVGRDLEVRIIASGKANHAGKGGHAWLPRNLGNPYSVGIGVEHAGTGAEAWNPKMLDTVAIITRVVNRHIGASLDRVMGHKEYTSRKSDPYRIDMNEFRRLVRSEGVFMQLQKGALCSRVVLLQRQLQRMGVYSGPMDGDFGPGTEDAVKKFQASRGLVADGIVGEETRGGLDLTLNGGGTVLTAPKADPRAYPGVTRKGHRGGATRSFQELLGALGYGITADSIHGDSTEFFIRDFQALVGLVPDGVGGPKTWDALISAVDALPKEDSKPKHVAEPKPEPESKPLGDPLATPAPPAPVQEVKVQATSVGDEIRRSADIISKQVEALLRLSKGK